MGVLLDDAARAAALAVGQSLLDAKLTVATAESCTGGLVGALLTIVPGSSAYFMGGAVVYANAAKARLLGVPPELIATHGAVSRQVAVAMAEGARLRLASDLAVSVTGVAGPDGGTTAKPVGRVYIGIAGPEGTTAYAEQFHGDRDDIRRAAAQTALERLRAAFS